MNSLFEKLKSVNVWYLLVIIIITSEIFTYIFTTAASLLWYGSVNPETVRVGVVDAFLVSLIVGAGIIYFVKKVTLLQATTEKLEMEISMKEKTEMKLQKSFDELKSIEILKSDILSNVSHELKTPITIIQTSLELAEEEEDPLEKNELVKTALDSIRRQLEIVDNFLAVSQMEKIHLKIQNEDAVEIIRREIEGKSLFANKKGVMVELLFSGKSLFSPVDKKSLGHIMKNLIDNGIKFNNPGGRVEIRLKENEDFLEIEVADDGIGIEEKEIPRIFDPLTQLDPSAERMFGGTGTGLAVVKKLVEAHGGRISVESKIGEGSVFRINLPLKDKLSVRVQ